MVGITVVGTLAKKSFEGPIVFGINVTVYMVQAHVKLVYLQGDGTELSFTRGITLQSASEYRIDDKVVSWDEYNNKMRSLGILVKARNFLVFQVIFLQSSWKAALSMSQMSSACWGQKVDPSLSRRHKGLFVTGFS